MFYFNHTDYFLMERNNGLR